MAFSVNEPIGIYQFTRVIYGQAAAPFLSVRAMRQCATGNAHEYPDAAETVLDSSHIKRLW